MIFLIMMASILCGTLGRMGGSGRFPRQSRIVGIPLVSLLLLWILGVNSWWLALTFFLMVGGISTYWDFLFGYDNFWFHGFVIGLSLAPIAYVTGHWLFFTLDIALCSVWMGLWSKLISWDILEEFGRYFIIPLACWLVVH